MRSGKGKRRQISIKQEATTEQDIPNLQETHEDENDGDIDDEHSDSVSSQRSWSPVIKPRRRFSASETQFLEAEYAEDINPSTDQLEIIAQTIGTTRRVITTWFQNHRAKGKRNNKTNVHSITKKNKNNRKVHTLAPKSRAARKNNPNNLTQPEMIGSTPGPSCHCINQDTVVDANIISSGTTLSDDPTCISDTFSSLDTHHHYSSPPILNTYHTSYFVPDTMIPLTVDTTWNHHYFPSFSSSNTPLNTWSPSNPMACHPVSVPVPPRNLYDNSSLPQCCLDELYTGYPCPFHTLHL